MRKELCKVSAVCHQAANTKNHMLTESKKGDTTMLTTSRLADQKASPEGVEIGLSMDLIKIQYFDRKE